MRRTEAYNSNTCLGYNHGIKEDTGRIFTSHLTPEHRKLPSRLCIFSRGFSLLKSQIFFFQPVEYNQMNREILMIFFQKIFSLDIYFCRIFYCFEISTGLNKKYFGLSFNRLLVVKKMWLMIRDNIKYFGIKLDRSLTR